MGRRRLRKVHKGVRIGWAADILVNLTKSLTLDFAPRILNVGCTASVTHVLARLPKLFKVVECFSTSYNGLHSQDTVRVSNGHWYPQQNDSSKVVPSLLRTVVRSSLRQPQNGGPVQQEQSFHQIENA